jgi:Arc/MetJ family transcription regulator
VELTGESSPGPRGFQDVPAQFSSGSVAMIAGQLAHARDDLSRSPLGAIVMHMPTLEIDKALLAKAQQLTGLRRKAAVVNAGLEALIARESGRQLIALGATERELRAAPRRRQRATRSGA